ncbi:MAG: hypothetical protein ACI8W8_004937 [Rhodothermales bacterium]|jgi:hypothetical protein
MRKLHVLIILFLFGAICASAAKTAAKTWTDPESAAAEDPDFALQGEYVGMVLTDDGKQRYGLQVVAMGGGKFVIAALPGGLPGDGWDGEERQIYRGSTDDGQTIIVNREGVRKAVIENGVLKAVNDEGGVIGELKKVERKSPTLGAKAPEGATVLFDGSNADAWKGKMDGKYLAAGASSKQSFGAFKLHIEFRLPYKPSKPLGNQDRGNSGIYTYNRYETQVLDSFGMHYNRLEQGVWAKTFEEEVGYRPSSDRKQWCGCFYKFKLVDMNACLPPLAWQTYDLEFTPPTFADGKKVKHARISVRHNGVLIHDDVEMVKGGTGAGGGRPEIPEGQIFLQGHGNPVVYRNVWVQEQ